MRPMRRLIDVKLTYKKVLQSLPVALAAIAVVIYALSFLPRSAERMRRAVALVERVSYYRVCADGKPVAWFRELGDSLRPVGLSPSADSTVVTVSHVTAAWVDKYPFIPSCPGLLLVANADSMAHKQLSAAGGNVRPVLENAIGAMERRLSLIGRKIEDIDYYMRIHNVNDDGYNVMAAYDVSVKAERDSLTKVVGALRSALGKRRLTVELVEKYTLLTADTAGGLARTACVWLTADKTSPFMLLQTVDKRKPDGASAVYLHQWLTPVADAGDSVVVASYPGCALYGFSPAGAKAQTFKGAAAGKARHALPPLLAPDGSLVFSSGGQLEGVSVDGRIVRPSSFGFGLKRLLP